MRVRRKEMANRIKSNLAYLSNICSDKEEIVDAIFHYFARLYGIGVAVEEKDILRTIYTFLKYPSDRKIKCDTFESVEESTCLSATAVIDHTLGSSRQNPDNMKRVLKFIEDKLHLPHWEDYLAEEKKEIGSGFIFENPTRPASPDSEKVSDQIADGISDELKEQIKTLLNSVYGAPKKHDDRPYAMYYLAARGYDKLAWATDKAVAYCKNDVKVTQELHRHLQIARNSVYGLPRYSMPGIAEVIFHDPATIIIWRDGTKTVVKAQDGEAYDPEKGLAMAICKKTMGNTRDYYNVFLKYLKQWKKENPENDESSVSNALSRLAKAFSYTE